jgi:hypothetical protein
LLKAVNSGLLCPCFAHTNGLEGDMRENRGEV